MKIPQIEILNPKQPVALLSLAPLIGDRPQNLRDDVEYTVLAFLQKSILLAAITDMFFDI